MLASKDKKKVSKFLVFNSQNKTENFDNFFKLAKKNSISKGKIKEDLALSVDKVLYGKK